MSFWRHFKSQLLFLKWWNLQSNKSPISYFFDFDLFRRPKINVFDSSYNSTVWDSSLALNIEQINFLGCDTLKFKVKGWELGPRRVNEVARLFSARRSISQPKMRAHFESDAPFEQRSSSCGSLSDWVWEREMRRLWGQCSQVQEECVSAAAGFTLSRYSARRQARLLDKLQAAVESTKNHSRRNNLASRRSLAHSLLKRAASFSPRHTCKLIWTMCKNICGWPNTLLVCILDPKLMISSAVFLRCKCDTPTKLTNFASLCKFQNFLCIVCCRIWFSIILS